MVSPDLGCLPDGATAVECWIDTRTGHGSDGHSPYDEPSVFLCDVEGDTYWIGPLDAGIWIAAQSRYPRVSKGTDAAFVVHLCDDEEGTSAAEWGGGATVEIAWRYALGAHFGPVDDDYDEDYVCRIVRAYADPVPDELTPEQIERWLSC